MKEGRNAGVWTVGVVFGGNELGLSREETESLSPEEREARYTAVGAARPQAAGAHYIIRGDRGAGSRDRSHR